MHTINIRYVALARNVQQQGIQITSYNIQKFRNQIKQRFSLLFFILSVGLSVLEGGECPKYLNIMLAEKEAEEYQQFRRGLSKTGILQVYYLTCTHNIYEKQLIPSLTNEVKPSNRQQYIIFLYASLRAVLWYTFVHVGVNSKAL